MNICGFIFVYTYIVFMLTFLSSQIYKYDEDTHADVDGPFKGRLTWNGSQDLQDVSIEIVNVTYNDSGIYECNVLRMFEFDFFKPSISITKNFTLRVNEKGGAKFIPCYSVACFCDYVNDVSGGISELSFPCMLHTLCRSDWC